MFINDQETEIDLLYYDVIAKTVVKLIRENPDVPLSIGIHGDWGAGKSSVLAMTESVLKEDKDIVCLHFNGWQFQGFEDAKAALIETIITELREARSGVEKFKERATELLKRVDYLKLAKKGMSWAFSLATGIPHPEQIKDALSLLKGLMEATEGEITTEKINETVSKANGILKPGEERKIPEQMRAFQNDFRALLEAAKINKLVILIDDLDRCLPATAIETLEAIRLFLFVPKTAFVVAADEAMIEYAVKQHFPDLPLTTGPLTYARNYLEKLIQVPFRIPALGYTETQTFVTLVFLQAELGCQDENFQKLLAKARENLCKPWKSSALDQKAAQDCIASDGQTQVSSQVTQAITLSNQISRILTDGTKGNPRQIKRFLNSLFLRYQIAEARGLAGDIKQPVLAKVMLAESFAPQFYDQLTRATYGATEGRPRELKALENAIRLDVKPEGATAEKAGDLSKEKEVPKEVSDWLSNEWAKTWAKIDPPLKGVDLRPYMFVTRDKRSYFGGVAGTSHLDEIVEALLGRELAVKTVEQQLPKLDSMGAEQVFDAVQSRIIQAEEFKDRPHGLIALTKAHPRLQNKLLAFISGIPIAKLAGWPVTGFDTVFTETATKSEYISLREKWAEQDENPALKAAAKYFGKKKQVQPRRR